jgi:hypothetical protein
LGWERRGETRVDAVSHTDKSFFPQTVCVHRSTIRGNSMAGESKGNNDQEEKIHLQSFSDVNGIKDR